MKPVCAFVVEMAALLAAGEQAGKDVSLTVTRLMWFYAEKTGADYMKLAENVMLVYVRDWRGDTSGE